VAVKIKLKRIGKTRNPQYRIVIADARTARSGRAIEEIGIYQPRQQPSLIRVDSERAQYWLGVGAQPTEAVTAIFKVTGDWQKFKGLPGTEGTMETAAPKADKRALYEAAVREADEAAKSPRARAPRHAETASTESAPAEASEETPSA
jgi:small subunit ribosomal protein S16